MSALGNPAWTRLSMISCVSSGPLAHPNIEAAKVTASAALRSMSLSWLPVEESVLLDGSIAAHPPIPGRLVRRDISEGHRFLVIRADRVLLRSQRVSPRKSGKADRRAG